MTKPFSRYFIYVASRVFVRLGINKGHNKHLSVFYLDNRNFMVNRKVYRNFMERVESLIGVTT